jgi:hypothetical protein
MGLVPLPGRPVECRFIEHVVAPTLPRSDLPCPCMAPCPPDRVGGLALLRGRFFVRPHAKGHETGVRRATIKAHPATSRHTRPYGHEDRMRKPLPLKAPPNPPKDPAEFLIYYCPSTCVPQFCVTMPDAVTNCAGVADLTLAYCAGGGNLAARSAGTLPALTSAW